MPLLIKCNRCLVEVSQSDRFCRQCGQLLTSATVIVADMQSVGVGCHDDSGDLGAEASTVDYTNYSLLGENLDSDMMSADRALSRDHLIVAQPLTAIDTGTEKGQKLRSASSADPWYVSSEFDSLVSTSVKDQGGTALNDGVLQSCLPEVDKTPEFSKTKIEDISRVQFDAEKLEEHRALDFSCAQSIDEACSTSVFFSPEEQLLNANGLGQSALLSAAGKANGNVQVYKTDESGADEDVDFRKASVFGQKSDLFALSPTVETSTKGELQRFAGARDISSASALEQVPLDSVRFTIEQRMQRSGQNLDSVPSASSQMTLQAGSQQSELHQAEPPQTAPPQAGSQQQARPQQARPLQAEPLQAEPLQAEPLQGGPQQPIPAQTIPQQAISKPQQAVPQEDMRPVMDMDTVYEGPAPGINPGILSQKVEVFDKATDRAITDRAIIDEPQVFCASRSELPEFLMKAAARSAQQPAPAPQPAVVTTPQPLASSDSLTMPPKPLAGHQKYVAPGSGTAKSSVERPERLRSPILSKPTSSQDFDSIDYEEEKNSGSEALLGMPRKLVTIAAAVILILGIACGAWLFFEEKQRQDLKMRMLECSRLMNTARIAFDGGRYEEAMKQMERLTSCRKGNLTNSELVFMDDVRFVLGKTRYDNGDFEQARNFLSAISSGSEKYTMAQPMLLALSTSEPESSADSSVAKAAAPSGVGGTERSSIADVARSTFGVAPTSEAPRKRIAYKPSEEKSLSLPKLEKIKEESSSADSGWSDYAENQHDQTVARDVPASEVPAEKFSEADVTKYNAMLEKHFTSTDSSSSDSAKAGSEPPTFEQWLKDGKTDF